MPITGSQKAWMYAQFGVARFGATRFGYHSAHAFLSIGGVQVAVGYAGAGRVLLNSPTVTDILNEQPNRMEWTAMGARPTAGQEAILQLGSMNGGRRMFGGHILDVQQFYVGQKPAAPNIQYQVSAVDYTWQLGFQKVTAFYAEQSATTIAQSLISAYAAVNGFTSANVQAGLPTVPGGITFTDEDLPNALTRLAKRIGGYWYVDYFKDLHFFLTDTGPNPADLVAAHPSLADFVHGIDLSQHINRVYVEGRGSSLLGAVLIGDTMIPLIALDMFTVMAGVFAKVSFQGSDGGAQHLTYTGVVPGGGGTLVGPGIGPASAPTLTPAGGAGLGTGLYLYAVTFITAAGESLPSPTASVTTGVVAPPTTTMGVTTQSGGSINLGHHYWAYTFVNAAGETTAGPLQSSVVAGTHKTYNFFGIQVGPSGTTARKIYRTVVYGPGPAPLLKLVGTIADNTTTTFTDAIADASLGAAIPTVNTATSAQVDLTNIPIGAAAVTQRKVYRTVVGGAQLKLQSTIANNSATTLLDATADGSLGANVPTTDTSGLLQPDGQFVAGSITLQVAGTGAFQAGGGWAVIGNGEQVIRYTGISAGSLTGIPASGVGAITAAVSYNSTVTAAPMLTGIPATGTGSIATGLSAGDEVYLVVQRDDTAAQATLATRLGGDGIREEWIQDRRLSIPEATARGDAFLASRPLDAASVNYTCRDLNTVSGKDIVVNLVAPTSVAGTFKIQQVVISDFRPFPNQLPTFAVQASAQRHSFEDLLRRAR